MRAYVKVIALILCIAVISSVCVYAQSDETLKLVAPPSRTGFYEGRDWGYINGAIYPYANFDLSGAVLEYEGEQIPFYVFPWGANMWCEPVSGKWTTGANDVYIFSDDIDNVYVKSSINLYSISYVTVAEQPVYTDYIRGIDWNYDSKGKINVDSVKLDGLKLNIFYQDGTSGTVAYNKKDKTVTWAVLNDSYQFRIGTNELYAVYCDKKAGFSINIELEKITKAYVETSPKKRSYAFGTDWKYVRGKVTPEIDLSGLVAGAGCNNGEVKYIYYSEEPERFSVAEGQSFNTGLNYVKVLLDSEFEMPVEFTAESYGDIDFDGFINSTDALIILKYVVGASVLDAEQQRYADVDDDGKITSTDALSVLRRSVGLIKLFKAEI